MAGYLDALARPDGGYGWADQPDGHLTATWAAVGSTRLLGRAPARDKAALAAFVRTHHPYRREGSKSNRHAAELRTFVLQQIQTLKAIGEDPAAFAAEVRNWVQPTVYPKTYEKSSFPVLEQETMAFVCRAELGLPLDDVSPALIELVTSRRRADGSFNTTPASDGTGGNVLNTAWGTEALRLLGKHRDLAPAAIAWLRGCQTPAGGFAPQPDVPMGRLDDVVVTWAAVRTLKQLGGAPARASACAAYLRSLWNDDGGFGFRPGLPSDPVATFHALDALAALGALESLADATPRPIPAPQPLPDGLKAFTVQIEAPGRGSPTEAVELARALRIHLWGAKNSPPGWIDEAQAIARARGVGVTFCVSDEEYGTYVGLPGLGVWSHLVDLMAPAGVDFGRSMSGKDPTWEQFDRERIAPLRKAGGLMIWQICDGREVSGLMLDESLRTGAYAAISTFHMRQNFFDFLPFLARYRHEIPFVSLQDAHGEESWNWADDLAGYRTVFLAREPTWEGWREALRNNWVVSIRHDEVTRWQTRILGGAPGVQEMVRRQEALWRSWGDNPGELHRPPGSIVVLRPESKFEAGRPDQGWAVRVRPAWRNNPQGVLTAPIAELASATLDGKPIALARVEKKDDKGKLVDVHHRAGLPALTPGEHRVTAVFRLVGSGEEKSIVEEFVVP